MKKSDSFILLTVVVGVILNLGAAHIDRRFPPVSAYASTLLAAALLLYLCYRVFDGLLHYLRFGRYAVLIFFLNSKNQLLLIRHPYHKCYLPPGGRLSQWELPHEAVSRKLKEEVGVTSYELHPTFHNPPVVISEKVEDVPRPYTVHMEHRRQRNLIRFHYAFVYVCRFKGNDETLPRVADYEPHFFDLESIYNMPRGTIPYDDIIRRYEDILIQLGVPHYVDKA